MREADVVCEYLNKKAQDKDYVFQRLYRNFYNPSFFNDSAARVYGERQKGRLEGPPEVVEGFGEKTVLKLIDELKTESYQPPSLKEDPTKKRKRKKKKRRKYDPPEKPEPIPFEDKVVLDIAARLLDIVYEPVFSERSHGFREGRSAHTALLDVRNRFRHATWFIDGHIDGFYSGMNAPKLRRFLSKRIEDDKFERLISKYLKKGYLNDWEFDKTYSGLPVGNDLAETLSNVYLNELDNYVEGILAKEFNKGGPYKLRTNPEYANLIDELRRLESRVSREEDQDRRKNLIKEAKKLRGKIRLVHTKEPFNEGFKRLEYVRYGDRWLIGVTGTKEEAVAVMEKVNAFLKEELELTPSEKTEVVHARDGVKFLEYTVRKREENADIDLGLVQPVSPLRYRIALSVPKGTVQRAVARKKMVKDMNRRPWIPMSRREFQNLEDKRILEVFNSEIKRHYTYYSIAENVQAVFSQLGHIMEVSCLKTLSAKHKCSLKQMRTKLRMGKQWGIGDKKRPDEALKFFKEYKRSYTPKSYPDVDLIKFRPKLRGENLSQRLENGFCEICGAEDEDIRVHYNADYDRKAVGSKTVLACPECYDRLKRREEGGLIWSGPILKRKKAEQGG